MRLFIAIQFEEKILDALSVSQDDLKAQGVTGNYTNFFTVPDPGLRRLLVRGVVKQMAEAS